MLSPKPAPRRRATGKNAVPINERDERRQGKQRLEAPAGITF